MGGCRRRDMSRYVVIKESNSEEWIVKLESVTALRHTITSYEIAIDGVWVKVPKHVYDKIESILVKKGGKQWLKQN